MIWCTHCARNITRPDIYDDKICCSACGKVLREHKLSSHPTLEKDAVLQQLVGDFMKAVQGKYSPSSATLDECIAFARLPQRIPKEGIFELVSSRERKLDKAYFAIKNLVDKLEVDGDDSIHDQAQSSHS